MIIFFNFRFNCLHTQSDENKPTQPKTYDEISCEYQDPKSPKNAKNAKNGQNQNEVSLISKENEYEIDSQSAMDITLISWILIGVCSALGILLMLIVVIGCIRNDFCTPNRDLLSENECFNERRNLADLSANRLQTEPNVYLPLDTFRQPQTNNENLQNLQNSVQNQENSALVIEEPPPSYDSLFPTSENSDSQNLSHNPPTTQENLNNS